MPFSCNPSPEIKHPFSAQLFAQFIWALASSSIPFGDNSLTRAYFQSSIKFMNPEPIGAPGGIICAGAG